MRFLTRSLTGILILGLTLGLLAMAVSAVLDALSERQARGDRVRPPAERVFSVAVDTLVTGPAAPVIIAYGDVASWRTLELRAAAPGEIVEISPNLRDGGRVAAGEVLVRIDPADAEAARDLAAAERAEAEAELEEARIALELARADLAAGVSQRDLRAQALSRARDLLGRGAGTSAAVETAELALSAAEQALVGRRQALAQAEASIARAEIALTRRGITLREAERGLADTVIRAPFSGLVTAADARLGALVASGESLGRILDTGALEVAFRVTNAQYARLLGAPGGLGSVPVEATLPLGEFPIRVAGTLDRAGAEVGAGQTGRLLYARLDPDGAAALRPGDFLTVTIAEPPLDDVAVIPATAVDNAGRILLVGTEDRLEAATVRILRRQGDTLIVGDVPEGRLYVTERLPQLGPGVKVRPVAPDGASAAGGASPARIASDATVTLDPARRARLIAFVETSAAMPDEVKARIISQLGADEVPREIVERLESRMGG